MRAQPRVSADLQELFGILRRLLPWIVLVLVLLLAAGLGRLLCCLPHKETNRGPGGQYARVETIRMSHGCKDRAAKEAPDGTAGTACLHNTINE